MLLLSTVSLLRLDPVLLKKLSLAEIEKESEGSNDNMVNEKRIMMITIDLKENLKLKYTFLKGPCLLAILLTLDHYTQSINYGLSARVIFAVCISPFLSTFRMIVSPIDLS